jgi:hypothetical protein
MHKVIDDYLPSEQHTSLKNLMESDNFPWFFNKGKVFETDKLFDYQFLHIFYNENKINSNYFDLLNPLIKELKPLSLIRIKANLNPITNKLVVSDEHTDQAFKCKAAIYYVNSNNGYTMIGDKKIDSKENRIVLFNANEKHYGTNSTNCNNRMVINFNYF